MSYARLSARCRDVSHLDHAIEMLTWDEAVMMPRGGGAARADTMAALATLKHRLVTAPDTADLLAAAQGEALDEWQRANIREIERRFTRAAALPEQLVAARSRATVLCEQLWRDARARNDWQVVTAPLEEVLDLTREVADRLGVARNLTPYDALVDGYQSGLSTADIDPLFARLGAALPELIDRRLGTQGEPLPLQGPFALDAQARLSRDLMERIGFDFEHGRFDVSHHPFCGGVADDVRITTRYDVENFFSALMATLHESGHGMYQQGLPSAWREQPVGDAAGAALHESQSLLVEMQMCRGRPFLDFATPFIRRAFAIRESDPAWSTENIERTCLHVTRSLIRVDADELTYPLHIVLRYRLERALLERKLTIADLPEAWDAAMQELLGLRTRDDYRDGCMQDVHWFAGLVGYFPCYTVGAVMAAQLFAALRREIPDVDNRIGHGDFAPVRAWLRSNVHGQGAKHAGVDLIQHATGSPLSGDAYLDHLRARYGDSMR